MGFARKCDELESKLDAKLDAAFGPPEVTVLLVLVVTYDSSHWHSRRDAHVLLI